MNRGWIRSGETVGEHVSEQDTGPIEINNIEASKDVARKMTYAEAMMNNEKQTKNINNIDRSKNEDNAHSL